MIYEVVNNSSIRKYISQPDQLLHFIVDSLAREIVDADQVEGATSYVDVAVNRITRGAVVRSENLSQSLITSSNNKSYLVAQYIDVISMLPGQQFQYLRDHSVPLAHVLHRLTDVLQQARSPVESVAATTFNIPSRIFYPYI